MVVLMHHLIYLRINMSNITLAPDINKALQLKPRNGRGITETKRIEFSSNRSHALRGNA